MKGLSEELDNNTSIKCSKGQNLRSENNLVFFYQDDECCLKLGVFSVQNRKFLQNFEILSEEYTNILLTNKINFAVHSKSKYFYACTSNPTKLHFFNKSNDKDCKENYYLAEGDFA